MQKLIQFAMCGYSSADCNPYAATSDTITQRMLLAINSTPLSLHEVSTKIGVDEGKTVQCLEPLDRCGLLKRIRKGDSLRYQPSFAIFTLEDQKRLQPLTQRLSDSLTNTVKDLLQEIKEELENVECIKAGYSFPDLEYISIGAYAFDYDGLEVLRDEGLLTVSKEMPGGKYVFTGLEVGLTDLRKAWMWGHTGEYGKYTFSSHGKLPPKKGRRAFPDLLWLWRYAVQELARNLQVPKSELVLDLTFLEELDYVISNVEGNRRIQYRLNRPALLSKDCKLLHKLSKMIIKDFLDRSLRTAYGELESSYRQTSPARNGIDIKEAFNPIYHSIFEKALSNLIASEVISKPPLRRDGGQYSPWVAMENRAP
jgi:DNA-binding transcriptional ArsR family regulator/predicted transcriptional regulator